MCSENVDAIYIQVTWFSKQTVFLFYTSFLLPTVLYGYLWFTTRCNMKESVQRHITQPCSAVAYSEALPVLDISWPMQIASNKINAGLLESSSCLTAKNNFLLKLQQKTKVTSLTEQNGRRNY